MFGQLLKGEMKTFDDYHLDVDEDDDDDDRRRCYCRLLRLLWSFCFGVLPFMSADCYPDPSLTSFSLLRFSLRANQC